MEENADKQILGQDDGQRDQKRRRELEKRWMSRAVIGAVLAILCGILILCRTVF